jgi:hypothetical protein
MENQEIITITKSTVGILATLGLAQKKKIEVFRVSDNSIFYNSTLGDIGEINSEFIELIECVNFETTKVIKIKLKENFDLSSKLSKFRQKLSELYYKKTGAEILIFPNETDWNLDELYKILKEKLNK